jgi:hypothetical protein
MRGDARPAAFAVTPRPTSLSLKHTFFS